jgi:hypothetical protein
MKVLRKNYEIQIFLLLLTGAAAAQIPAKQGFRMQGTQVRGPQGNMINDIHVRGNQVLIGSEGLTVTDDEGATWSHFSQAQGIGKGSVSAIAARGDQIWIATAFDTTTELGTFSAGGGLSVSYDGGETWTWFPQPVDSRDETEYQPTTTVIQNLTYDIALTDSSIWIASFGGGLRTSSDSGATWKVVTVDGFPFSPLEHLSHRAFSVIYDGESLWAGTAGGVHKSDDGGETWITFSRQNQNQGISGNFVTALGSQKTAYGNILWAATVEALGESEYRAVSFTKDGGLNWEIVLNGEFAHNFAFDSLYGAVYAATDNGLYKSLDYGETWALFPGFQDRATGEQIFAEEVYCAGVIPGSSLWAGTPDGLARSLDEGDSWTLFRSFPDPGKRGTPDVYAYPNPFSPVLRIFYQINLHYLYPKIDHSF